MPVPRPPKSALDAEGAAALAGFAVAAPNRPPVLVGCDGPVDALLVEPPRLPKRPDDGAVEFVWAVAPPNNGLNGEAVDAAGAPAAGWLLLLLPPPPPRLPNSDMADEFAGG